VVGKSLRIQSQIEGQGLLERKRKAVGITPVGKARSVWKDVDSSVVDLYSVVSWFGVDLVCFVLVCGKGLFQCEVWHRKRKFRNSEK